MKKNPAKAWKGLKEETLTLRRNLGGREMQVEKMQVHKRGLGVGDFRSLAESGKDAGGPF